MPEQPFSPATREEAAKLNPAYKRMLSIALRKKGLVDEAIKLRTNDLSRGLALHRKGKFQEALAAFRTYLDANRVLGFEYLVDDLEGLVTARQHLIKVQANLPGAERRQWQQLWNDIDALRLRASELN